MVAQAGVRIALHRPAGRDADGAGRCARRSAAMTQLQRRLCRAAPGPRCPRQTRLRLPSDAPIAFPPGQPDRAGVSVRAVGAAAGARMAAAVVDGRGRAASVRPCRAAGRHRRLSRRGARLQLRARVVVVTSGMRQSLSLLAWLVLDPGDEAWIEEPGFIGTREALALAGVRRCRCRSTSRASIVERALAAAPKPSLRSWRRRTISRSAPCSACSAGSSCCSWAERTAAGSPRTITTASTAMPAGRSRHLRALDRNGRVAYLGSFSKLLFPALRLSYVVLPEALVAGCRKAHDGDPRASLAARPGRARPLHRRRPSRRPYPAHAAALRQPPRSAGRRRSSAISRAGWRAFPTALARTWSRGPSRRSRPASTTSRRLPPRRSRGMRRRRSRPAMPAGAAGRA